MIRYGNKRFPKASALIYQLNVALSSPLKALRSLTPDTALSSGEVAGVMCVWDEQHNVGLALESSKDFVDRYIVVDKNGGTIPVVKEYADKFDLDVEYHVMPSLGLSESRLFAIEKSGAEWILVQDGDEVYSNSGANDLRNLRRLMVYPNIIVRSRKNVLVVDYLHTQEINNGYHNFFFHNNGCLKATKERDVPYGCGRVINLKPVYIFNLTGVKPPKELFYRQKYWRDYNLREGYTRFKSIEEFVKVELGVEVTDETVDEWFSWYRGRALPYDEKVQGPLPQVLLKKINDEQRSAETM
jgi:glycosyltransferase involved in cell wall biosynthesis